MKDLIEIFRQKLPAPWEIKASGSGLISIHDSGIEKGKGYNVNILEGIQSYQTSVVFENFAREIYRYAEQQLSTKGNIIRQIIQSKPGTTLTRRRNIVEDVFMPSKIHSETWSLEVDFRKSENRLRDNIVLSDLILALLLFIFPYDIFAEEEGMVVSNNSGNRYERSRLNRSICLAFYGYDCMACGTNLEKIYGEVARRFIQVHHINPLSESGLVTTDPIRDLVPLCPNCHMVAHLREPCLTIDQIKLMLSENNGKLSVQ